MVSKSAGQWSGQHPVKAVTSVLLVSVLVPALTACSAQPSDALVVETSAGITYLRDTGAETAIDDVRYEGVLIVGDDACLYVEVVEGPLGLYRVVIPPDIEVTAESVRADGGQTYSFGERVNFARAFAPYFDEGLSGNDGCNGSLELFGVSGPR